MRLLLLLPTSTYRTEAFVAAALRLGVELTVASEQPSTFEQAEPDRLLTLDFTDPRRAVAQAVRFATRVPIHGVFGIDDRTAVIAAAIAEELALAHSTVDAVRAAGDKYLQRTKLRAAAMRVPDFERRPLARDPAPGASRLTFPVVLKPLHLSASRGVIRADDAEEFATAHRRIAHLLSQPDVVAESGPAEHYLVEDYVPGAEFAIEGLVLQGQLHVLALFDKPDPLEGPYFEETIYTTPSRAAAAVQEQLIAEAQAAVTALGLTRGPVHAELRYNERGAWLIELAARPIGGRCGQVLRFGPDGTTTLEELHLAHALGMRTDVPPLAPGAHGVMMIPIAARGRFEEVRGLEAARAVAGVTDAVVTIPRGQRVAPLPDESRYLGFIFATGANPDAVERSLRKAYAALDIVLTPEP